ncbi:uncharacterized protein LOC122251873 [Penaeus japonicus]|uniref:uncharacterized protein LOC122251873 n=1 Tax=Penaeus japonicus TaxID=27405 RepID=UPI001C715FAD|nr:uncharacterized protein LOC122251873 [Penaeus japonicus]
MMPSAWTTTVLVVAAASLLAEGATTPVRSPSSLTRFLAPVVRHRLEEGRLPAALVEELVADFEDPELMDFHDADKRQFDEYGHMRFGKRAGGSGGVGGEYDDYGHLRFGRSLSAMTTSAGSISRNGSSRSNSGDRNDRYNHQHHHRQLDGSAAARGH